MPLFDLIGEKYDGTRRADPGIARKLVSLIETPSGGVVADIGAGTGNYSEVLAQNNYKVYAIEPSEIMRSQAKKNAGIFWLDGVAENLPLKDKFVDAVTCVAAIHHFSDLEKAFEEMYRIVKPGGKVVIFGADHKARKNFWLDDYFDPTESNRYPTAKETGEKLEKVFTTPAAISHFPIPADVRDCFFVSGWRRPWFYLDDNFCHNISPLAKASPEKLSAFQNKLKKDIFSGEWEKKYGKILDESTFDGGYFFAVATKPI